MILAVLQGWNIIETKATKAEAAAARSEVRDGRNDNRRMMGLPPVEQP